MLKTNHLEVRYHNQLALNIHRPIEFLEGDRIGIIGSNGAGKSTFVKAVLGLVHYQGNIELDVKQEDISVHMQFNNYANTMPVKTVMETILNTSIKKNAKLKELITYFDFEKCLNKKFEKLSGGQKQRLTIIMLLIQEKPLIFFDEVTSGLDFETRQRLMEKLIEWYENKPTTICMISHYYEELEHLVNKLLILDEGNVIDFDTRENLFAKYCGKTVFVLDRTPKNELLTKGMNLISAPNHLIAISCREEEDELRTAHWLISHNVDFKRSQSDIEIMSMNAKEAYYGEKKESFSKSKKESGDRNDVA